MKANALPALLVSVPGGILLSAAFVNPFGGTITLSELVLQLSGSSGEFRMSFTLPDLFQLIQLLLPGCLFECYYGTVIYSRFCTASVYVFSRFPKRLKWYFTEVLSVLFLTCFYQGLLLGSAVLFTMLRHEVVCDIAGVLLLLYHFAIHAMWVYCMTLAVNFLAVWKGSESAFVFVLVFQSGCVALLPVLERIGRMGELDMVDKLLPWNPVSHLILGWHSSMIELVRQAVPSPYAGLSVGSSMVFCLALCVLIVGLGAGFIQKKDLIVSNTEEG